MKHLAIRLLQSTNNVKRSFHFKFQNSIWAIQFCEVNLRKRVPIFAGFEMASVLR